MRSLGSWPTLAAAPLSTASATVRRSLTAPRVLLLFAVSTTPAIAQYQPETQPGEPPAAPPVEAAEHLYIYAKNGQTQEQQWADRYACHSWAKSQSGFDPTKQPAGVPPDEHASRREQYRRAMTACLEARGYSVRYAAPPPYTPPPSAPAPHGGTPLEHLPPLPELKYHLLAMPIDDYGDFFRYRPFHIQLSGGSTITQGTAEQNLDNGWNVGAGLTWHPTSHLPVALRVDGIYNHFDARNTLLNSAATRLGTPVNNGTIRIWGGDADVELDFRLSLQAQAYLIGGVGWYDEQDTFRQAQLVNGTVYSIVARSTTGVHFARNAGIGIEFAVSEGASFFVDARYMRINPMARKLDLVPIRFGLRF